MDFGFFSTEKCTKISLRKSTSETVPLKVYWTVGSDISLPLDPNNIQERKKLIEIKHFVHFQTSHLFTRFDIFQNVFR